ncbi:MAG: GtrA family protein [Spirulina sp. SIO3F2]|nr:GtrA family protein [Spirulina sp. SIO3F2]
MVITKRPNNSSLPKFSVFCKRLFGDPKVRWFAVGLFFTGFNFPVLYLLQQKLLLSDNAAILIASEISLVVRFFVNDRWVFGQKRPTWKRFWQYHVATASSFVIWNGTAIGAGYLLRWQFSTVMPDWLPLQLAALIATCCSFGWSMFTNFFWVWRQPKASRRPPQN